MSKDPYREYKFEVRISVFGDGSAEAGVWVRLRSGEYCPATRQCWPGGAPTPLQLALLQAAVDDELQTFVLTKTGVQGVLFGSELE